MIFRGFSPEEKDSMDDIQTAVKACFAKYATFTGRSGRPEFWWFALFQAVVLTILGYVSIALYSIAALALLVPGIAVGVRRLHDINKTGWLMLLGLIPLVGWIILVYFAVQPGDAGPNQYGEPPQTPPAAELVPGQQ
jgi:uncharacterized membrane protein YhaH (DUF805 family)